MSRSRPKRRPANALAGQRCEALGVCPGGAGREWAGEPSIAPPVGSMVWQPRPRGPWWRPW
eukprot:8959864-Heterocapsa_arctica.AAC.1